MVRYADNFVVCCHSRQQAEQVKARLAGWLAPRGWPSTTQKTKIVSLESGYDFLGFSIRQLSGCGHRARFPIRIRPRQ